MRASYVNSPELLTPVGEWIAARLPHTDSRRDIFGKDSRIFRVFGLRPYYRLCLFDYTRTCFYTGRPPHVRVRLGGWTVYERNRPARA